MSEVLRGTFCSLASVCDAALGTEEVEGGRSVFMLGHLVRDVIAGFGKACLTIWV